MISYLDRETGTVYPVTEVKRLDVKMVSGKGKSFVAIMSSQSVKKPQRVELGESAIKVTKRSETTLQEFQVGQEVVVVGKAKGKGFQGVVKR